MSELIYEPIPQLTQSEIEAAIERDDPDELLRAILAAALYQEREIAEPICIRLASHAHFNVRGNALLGFAHIARLHSKLDQESIKPIIRKGLTDEHEYVRGHARDAKKDTEFYLDWKY